MMLNRFRHKWHIHCLVAFAAFAALVVAVSATCRRSSLSRQSEPWESRMFSRYVLEQIPKSVADIKVDELEHPGLGHSYVMRFRIEKADVALILNSRAFKEFPSIIYEQEQLIWRGIDQAPDPLRVTFTGGGCPLYTNRQHEAPEWFRPNEWTSPKVHVVREKHGKSTRYKTKVLIFDEKLEEAYFVEYLQGH